MKTPTYKEWLAKRPTMPNRNALLKRYLSELRMREARRERRRRALQYLAVGILAIIAMISLVSMGILIGMLLGGAK